MTKIASPPSINDLLAAYKAKFVARLPNDNDNKRVHIKRQEAELRSLKATLHNERFFLVIDLHEMEVSHRGGINQWLGYSDKDFDFYTYLKIIHPHHLNVHTITSKAMLDGLNKGEIKLEFMKHRYNSLIALKHYKGHYLLCKRMACVFQYNKKNQLTEYINEFTILGEFREEAFTVKSASDKEENEILLTRLLETAKQNFEKMKVFSETQLQMLRVYAYNRETSVEQTAQIFRVKKNTTLTHNKRIIESAEDFFAKKFASAREVAEHLKLAELL